MIRSDKRLAELKKVLDRGRHEEVEESVGQLRDEEPFEGALNLLAHFYDQTPDDSLKKSISQFFNDMKEKSARGEVIGSIASVTQHYTKAMIVSSCWQSGLDYSAHSVAIADAFLQGDYNTSLECFTVLETFSPMIPAEDKTLIIKILKKSITSFEMNKQGLAKELISILTD